MELVSVHIRNFRSIRRMTVRLGDITMLIGANGTGKTTVLDALALVASEDPAVSDDDYYPRSRKVEITLRARPGGHAVHGRFVRNGIVAFQRSFAKGDGASALLASARCNADFDGVRAASKVSEIREEIKKIENAYPDFPKYTTMDEWRRSFADYELRLSRSGKHRAKYRTRYVDYDGGGGLAEMLAVIRVPAMKDIAEDGQDGADSLLSDIMKLAVRDSARSKAALGRFSRSLKRAHSLYKREVGGMIGDLDDLLAASSRLYMEGAEFRIGLDADRRKFDHPRASVRMGDGGFMAAVGQAGSGLQRVYLLSLLDALAKVRARCASEEDEGGEAAAQLRLFAIDEPELCQHPQRQRNMLKNFIGLVGGDKSIRIVCSTHSPYMVELRRVDALRLLRRGHSRAESVTLEGLVGPMLGEEKSALPGGREELSTWLDMNATHWITEGFFARVVALVEGPGDRNMLLATVSALSDDHDKGRQRGKSDGGAAERTEDDIDLEGHEVSIAPMDGVGSMPKFLRMFAKFGIPTYPIWDLDHRHCGRVGRIQRRNKELMGLACGAVPQGAPKATCIDRRFACFEDTLTASLAEDLRACEGLLGKSEEYGELREARERDAEDTERKRRLEGKPNARDVIDSQKKFLNSKLNVYRMLMAVREKSPEALEKFDIVRVVRMLDALGEEASVRAGGRPSP